MNVIDTLGFSKRLEPAGVPAVQAEAHALALAEVVEHVATKEWAECFVKEQLQQLKVDMLKWMFSMFIAQTGLLLAAMHYMMH